MTDDKEYITPRTIPELIDHLALMNYQGNIKLIAATFIDNNNNVQAVTVTPAGMELILIGAIEFMKSTLVASLVKGNIGGVPPVERNN